MRDVHRQLTARMERAGMTVQVDAVGNLRGVYPGSNPAAGRWLIGSHLDTVRDAGAFDGILGVVMGVALVEGLQGRRLPATLEVIGFSEEEGVRFGVPFIGSRALAGSLDDEVLERRDAAGATVRSALADYGLNVSALPDARIGPDVRGYFEMHIEQGPVLDNLRLSVGVVDAIVGQSRLGVTFGGAANDAGTTPMSLRRDALAGAAEWIGIVERGAREVAALVATVGRIEVAPGAPNVVPGTCAATLDVRHADDHARRSAVSQFVDAARHIADRRGLTIDIDRRLDQPAVAMSGAWRARLEAAAATNRVPVHVMPSGAGHDAMIIAGVCPAAMLLLRTPGGISHHPDETVLAQDVEIALQVGSTFLEDVAGQPACAARADAHRG
jgi:allantoate deiminase